MHIIITLLILVVFQIFLISFENTIWKLYQDDKINRFTRRCYEFITALSQISIPIYLAAIYLTLIMGTATSTRIKNDYVYNSKYIVFDKITLSDGFNIYQKDTLIFPDKTIFVDGETKVIRLYFKQRRMDKYIPDYSKVILYINEKDLIIDKSRIEGIENEEIIDYVDYNSKK